jgi:hypothetical protein
VVGYLEPFGEHLMRHSKWFWIRVVLTVLGGLSGVSIVSPETIKSSSADLDWTATLVIFLFAVVGTLFLLAIQALNPYSAEIWHKASWEVNPFLFREPLQFFHCGAYCFIACGLVACAILVYRGDDGFPLGVSLLALGAGLRLAVALSACVFRRKVQTRE